VVEHHASPVQALQRHHLPCLCAVIENHQLRFLSEYFDELVPARAFPRAPKSIFGRYDRTGRVSEGCVSTLECSAARVSHWRAEVLVGKLKWRCVSIFGHRAAIWTVLPLIAIDEAFDALDLARVSEENHFVDQVVDYICGSTHSSPTPERKTKLWNCSDVVHESAHFQAWAPYRVPLAVEGFD